MSDGRLWLACMLACVAACAESRREGSSVFDACFAGRELESWDEELIRPCEADVDLDADGQIDQQLAYEYDEQGRLLRESAGSVLLSETEYSDDGQTTTRSSYAPDGTLLSRRISTFGDQGLQSQARDDDGDGDIDSITTFDYACWEVSEEPAGPCVEELDWDGDGELNERTISEYDREGRVVLRTAENLMNGYRIVTRYSYGERSERQDTDLYDDGVIDSSSGRDFDADGNVLHQWGDYDHDGVAEQTIDYAYDDQGRKVLEVVMDVDGSASRKELRYEDHGRRVLETTIYEGQPELNRASERRYDGAGNLLVTAVDVEADGTLDSCAYVSYACWAE
jgi:hypothetical protein